MPDAMDRNQEYAEAFAADALANHKGRLQQRVGRTTCANLDCGDAIHPARTALGAQLCIECQREEEAVAHPGRMGAVE